MHRLKPLIPNCVSWNQNGFIEGRGTKINLVVASKILHSKKKKKGNLGCFSMKVDLKKAYDRMEWDFVRMCFQANNLDNHSISLIMNCITRLLL